MSDLKLLMHTCCAPCLIAPYYELKEAGISVTCFWFNLNIHPFTEYKERLKALQEFAAAEGFPLVVEDVYDLDTFITAVASDISGRCQYCYLHRLEATASYAAEHGYDAFSSTLLYSKYQNHELIRSIGQKMAERYGVEFYYQDFRPLWQKGIELSKAAGMYRQKYCGCIFSERDRYQKKAKS